MWTPPTVLAGSAARRARWRGSSAARTHRPRATYPCPIHRCPRAHQSPLAILRRRRPLQTLLKIRHSAPCRRTTPLPHRRQEPELLARMATVSRSSLRSPFPPCPPRLQAIPPPILHQFSGKVAARSRCPGSGSPVSRVTESWPDNIPSIRPAPFDSFDSPAAADSRYNLVRVSKLTSKFL